MRLIIQVGERKERQTESLEHEIENIRIDVFFKEMDKERMKRRNGETEIKIKSLFN